MMPQHTQQEWRDLHAKLTALRDDPTASMARRQGAEGILAKMRNNPEAMAALAPAPPKTADLSWMEMDW